MAKNDGILGISLNHGTIAFTMLKAGHVSRTFWEEVPENIVDGNKILSRNLFVEFLQEKIKENGIKCKKIIDAFLASSFFSFFAAKQYLNLPTKLMQYQ